MKIDLTINKKEETVIGLLAVLGLLTLTAVIVFGMVWFSNHIDLG